MTDAETPDEQPDEPSEAELADPVEPAAGADATEDFEDLDEPADFDVFTDPEVLDADGADDLADEISGEIIQLAAERDQYKDIAQRLQADFENYRKRVAAQQSVEIDRATGALAEALLPVLDGAEAAYVRHPDEVGPLLNLLLAELRKHGLEPIELLGQPFDPNLAEAVAHEPGDGGEVVVAEVLRSGYTWRSQTLRPAMVRTRD